MPNFWCCWKVFKSNKNTTPSVSHVNWACSHVEPSGTFLPSLVTRALEAAKFRVFLSTRTRCMEIFTAHRAPQAPASDEFAAILSASCVCIPVAFKWHQYCLFKVGVKIKSLCSNWLCLTPKHKLMEQFKWVQLKIESYFCCFIDLGDQLIFACLNINDVYKLLVYVEYVGLNWLCIASKGINRGQLSVVLKNKKYQTAINELNLAVFAFIAF